MAEVIMKERTALQTTRIQRIRQMQTRSFKLNQYVLLSAMLVAPSCAQDVLNFSGKNALPNCAYSCDPLYAAQFECKSAKDPTSCFCGQSTLKVSAGICDTACKSDSERDAVAKFLANTCGGTKTKTGGKDDADPSSTASASKVDSNKEENKTDKALDFWRANWQWFLIGFLGIAVPLIAWALFFPVRRYYRKKRRNTTAINWSNVGQEDYARPPQRHNATPVNRNHNTSRGSSATLLGVTSMIRSSSAGSVSDNDAAKSFLTGSEYGSQYGAGPAMEESHVPSDGRLRHTVDGAGHQRLSPRHSQDLLNAPDLRSNRYTHPHQSPVPTTQLFQPIHNPTASQHQAASNRVSQPVNLQNDPRISNRVSQNPAVAPTGRRRSEGQQGQRAPSGPPAPVRMGHHVAELQQQKYEQQFQQPRQARQSMPIQPHHPQQQQQQQQQHYQDQQQWHAQQTQYQPQFHHHQHHQQHSYDTGIHHSTTFPLASNSRWEQEPSHHPQHVEQRVPIMHSARQYEEQDDYDDANQIGRAA